MSKTIRGRRCRTLTVSNTSIKLTGAPANAEITVNPAGSNNSLVWRSIKPGIVGNSLNVEYVNPGASNTLNVVFKNNTLTVNLGTDGAGDVTSTAQNILDYVNTNTKLVDTVLVIASGTISGTAAVVAKAAMTGGAAGTGDFTQSFTNGIIVCETNGIRVKSDGSDPSTSDGRLIPAGDILDCMDPTMDWNLYLSNLRLIRSTGTDATVSVELLLF